MTQAETAAPQKSTTVRPYSVPASTRGFFTAFERFAPGIGARWGERLWMTLPRRRAGDRPEVPGGEAFTVTMRGNAAWSGVGRPTDVTLVGRVWGQGPAVYLVHGWAGHRRQFGGLVAPLAERGLRVVAFDAPSHGSSGPGAFGPRSTTFPEIAAALATVAERWGRPRAVVAHSAGAIATTSALCDGLRADRLVLLAPMVGIRPHLRAFVRDLGAGDRVLARLEVRLEHRVGAPLHHFDVPDLGRAYAMPPTLVIHDRDDRSTPVGDGEAIAAAWPGATLHLTAGLGHNRLLADPEVADRVAGFVTSVA